MSLILSLETATDVCSVALHKEGILIADFNLFLEKAHSTALADLVHHTLNFTQYKKSDLKAIAVSKGPGSYTGLRIGTSLAKGICFGLSIPLIAVNTLEGLAWQVHATHPDKLLCPMIDARRMEVYYMIKDHTFNTKVETVNHVVKESSFFEHINNQPVCFFGSGLEKFKKVLGNHSNAIFVDDVKASAKSIGELAFQKFQEKDFEDLAYFEPFYLKEFIAGKPKKMV